ncbi:MAG TPA: RhuM family protein [Candidatus Omnitrophota bacterium]|nr:RhuM family protein [Candidatus Omnitrophota bacterium]
MAFQDQSKGTIVLYKNKVQVRLDKETVWLNLNQIGELFTRDKSVISRHLRNIFMSHELNRNSVVANFATTAVDGKTYRVEYFNLDAIISVGYRVNSKRGTQFRIWATNVLKKHLIDGFTLNEKRLRVAEHKYLELQKSLKLLGNVMHLEVLSDETKGLIRVISEYSRALDLLDDYDHGRLSKPQGTRRTKFKLAYEEARKIIEIMKRKFRGSPLFGQEKDESFRSSLETIYQTFGHRELYPTLEEKAAHLLYFVTKNHSFVDGNKRIAAALFICFLQKNHILLRKDRSRRVENNTLAALTLMIAASKPSEKETMIKVILNVLA